MIDCREIPDTNIIEFSIDGKISAEEYHKLAERALAFFQKHKKVRVLKEIITFDGFDFAIFKEKLLPDLLRHQGDITHAALVADEKWIEQISSLITPAFPCRVRQYKLNDLGAAREWLRTAKEDSIEVTSDSKGNCMCFKVTDKLTHHDYEHVLIPTLEAVIKECGKARLLVDFGKEFHGMEVHAMWDDTKFGLTHRHDFERMAIVGGPKWSKWAARLGEAMMPCEVHAFASEDYARALEWVNAPIKSEVGAKS